MESTIIIEEKKLDAKALVMSDHKITLDLFDYTDKGIEYRFEASAYDLEEDDFTVRCDLSIVRFDDQEAERSIENIELWEDDGQVELTAAEIFAIEQQINESLIIR